MTNLIKISLIGDILCDSSLKVENYYSNNSYDFSGFFSECKSIFDESDYVIANLETPITKNYSNLTCRRYEFNTPYDFAKAIKDMGVNFITTANNHCLDRGVQGLEDTINCLDELGLNHTGTFLSKKKKESSIITLKGMKIGVMSYTYGTNAFSNKQYLSYKDRKIVNLTQEQERWSEKYKVIKHFLSRYPRSIFYRAYRKLERILDKKNQGKQEYERNTFDWYRKHLLKKDIKNIKNKTDLIIFYLHIGGQYNYEPSQYTKKMVDYLFDKGVDVVIANHEHVIHGTKIYKGCKFATYSIGNFFGCSGTFYEPFDRNSDYSVVPHLYCDTIGKKIEKISFTITKTIVDDNGSPKVVPVKLLLDGKYNVDIEKIKKDALNVALAFSSNKYDRIEDEFIL